MAKIKVDAQMLSWISKNVARKAQQLDALPEREKEKNKRAIEHACALDIKISGQKLLLKSDNSVTLALNRNDLRFLQSMALDQMVVLNSKTTVAYQERMKKNPDLVAEYQPYLDKAQATYNGLAELMEIINQGLK